MVSIDIAAAASGQSSEPSAERALEGLEYIISEEKLLLDQRIGRAVLPVTHFGGRMTERMIYGFIDPAHRFFQDRAGQAGQPLRIEKIRTMSEPAAGEERDIDRHSPRIQNRRARIARVFGFDELPQWELVASGEMSVVGPRPLLQVCIDRYAKLAGQGGALTEEVDEWREFLQIARPGIFCLSQAIRRKRSVNEYTPAGSLATVRADLGYKRQASRRHDARVIIASLGITVHAGIGSALNLLH